MVWTQESYHNSVNCNRSGECSPEKDCLRWHWLTFRQPERKSSSESSELWIVSRCYKSLVVVLIGRRSRDVIGRLSVKPWCYWLWRLLKIWLLGSNHLQFSVLFVEIQLEFSFEQVANQIFSPVSWSRWFWSPSTVSSLPVMDASDWRWIWRFSLCRCCRPILRRRQASLQIWKNEHVVFQLRMYMFSFFEAHLFS